MYDTPIDLVCCKIQAGKHVSLVSFCLYLQVLQCKYTIICAFICFPNSVGKFRETFANILEHNQYPDGPNSIPYFLF